jgi:RNA polymerase-binding transcription factor
MNEEKKESLRQHMTDRIDVVKTDIVNFEQLVKPVSPDNAIGRLTRMEAISNKCINEAALAKSKRTLAELERALNGIDDPEFGFCAVCEEPIPFARLMAMPESELCVQCATRRI